MVSDPGVVDVLVLCELTVLDDFLNINVSWNKFNSVSHSSLHLILRVSFLNINIF